ncbi:hypothetical protein RUM44_003499 [Polyplax serrata]|uniref:Uncharacterized protein n=1 Tax=Polyplax serrata TaxID=468196 RepID=A0ABR1AH80_POLSC
MKVKQNDTTRQNKERKTKRTDDLEKASGATQKASSPVGKKSGDAEKVKENQAEPEMARLNYGCKRKTNDFYPQNGHVGFAAIPSAKGAKTHPCRKSFLQEQPENKKQIMTPTSS